MRANRRRRLKKKRGAFWARVRTTFLLLLGVFVLGLAGLVASFSYAYYAIGKNLPNLGDYRSVQLAQTSTVYDANGNVISQLYGVQNRSVVGINDINPSLQHAVVAIEDHRFYQHRGLDFEAIARAAQKDVETLSVQQGGSTITQQLVKNTYIAPNERSVPSIQRKVDEAALAWQYEKKHSKREILGQYLNTVYFGANAYGAQAAAKTYFDKSAKDLTLPESALLAGIINLPGTYDPFADPKSARERRNVVLDHMLRYGYITKKQHDRAVASGLGLNRGRIASPSKEDEYFLDAVRTELAKQYGDRMVYEGGLKIYTTLDPALQKRATDSVNAILNPNAGDPSAALVSIEPRTGAVRALVGGTDFEKVKFNLATQSRRQPGSSFKPFVLAEMIRQGISPQSVYDSHNLAIPQGYGSTYYVQNYAGIQRGPITVAEAIAQSDNTVFVQLAMNLGLKNVVNMAHKLGITSHLDAYPSTAIGGLGEGVSPLEMASAYSTFANSGTHMEPYLIQRVTTEQNGQEKVLEEHHPKGTEALTRNQAALETELLRGVVEHGTASFFHNLDAELGRPSAGKTGTTENFADAWFVGYIPQLTTSVWVGYPGERKPMVNLHGNAVINGENFPLDIYSAYMQSVVPLYPTQQFDAPSPNLRLRIQNGPGVVTLPKIPKLPKGNVPKSSNKATSSNGTFSGAGLRKVPSFGSRTPNRYSSPQQTTIPSISPSRTPSSQVPGGQSPYQLPYQSPYQTQQPGTLAPQQTPAQPGVAQSGQPSSGGNSYTYFYNP